MAAVEAVSTVMCQLDQSHVYVPPTQKTAAFSK